MFSQSQFALVVLWLSWIIGGICGCLVLLIVIFHCCLMPKKQPNDVKHYAMEQISHRIELPTVPKKHNQRPIFNNEISRTERPISYAGQSICHGSIKQNNCHEMMMWNHSNDQERASKHGFVNKTPTIAECSAQYSSSSVLDEISEGASEDLLKTRSLPAFLRSKQRPLSTEDDLHELYAKVNFSKKRKNRMRNDDAAVIALSKSRSQCLNTDALVVYDERTAL